MTSPAEPFSAGAPRSDAARLPGTILLVEDDGASRDATRELIALSGHRVTAVSSKTDALRWCDGSARAPSLILSDYLLPESATGLDVIRAIRERFGKAVPAILITGLMSAEIATEAQSHACVLLRKPLSTGELLRHIANAIGEPPAGDQSPGAR